MRRKVIYDGIFVFCEGETEENYFQCLGSFLKTKISTHKLGEINITNYQKQIAEIWKYCKNGYKLDKKEIRSYKIKIFYLVDMDTIKGAREIEIIKKQCKQEGIEILFSNQNFELFILEHYQYFTKETGNYLDEIKKYVSEYKKGKSLTTKKVFQGIIENNLETMRTNFKDLKKFHEKHKRTSIYEMNPYSEVIELMEYLLRISNH